MAEVPSPLAPDLGKAGGITAPLRSKVFRNIWLAGLLSNLGLLIQGVGAAWLMVELSGSADLVALVQTAQMLPVMLFALISGAIADMFDRRKVALMGLAVAFVASASLSVVAYSGALTPSWLLAFCFAIGSGMALLWPAWQASIREQVPPASVPAAIALNSISYNLARSVGPAIGGAIVAAAGAVAAFVTNALFYLPLMVVLYAWRRVQEPPRLPPEGLGRAIVSGLRYVVHSPPTRTVLARSILTGASASAALALLPLVAQDALHGDATVFGVLLGAFGAGAVLGALNIDRIRRLMAAERAVRVGTVVLGLSTILVALSSSLAVTASALLFGGAAYMVTVTTFNIAIQVSAPRWVTGRALAAFQASIAGGMALGSWAWGLVAEASSLQTTLLLSAGALLALPLLGIRLPMPSLDEPGEEGAKSLRDPEVRLAITGRSGPVRLDIEYRVDPARARDFYRLMQQVRLSRQRNGGYGWSLSRDIADPAVWTESYACPTWLDYLRQRSRTTPAEQALYDEVRAFDLSGDIRVRRRLERPFGSVRWKEEAPDHQIEPFPGSPPPGSH